MTLEGDKKVLTAASRSQQTGCWVHEIGLRRPRTASMGRQAMPMLPVRASIGMSNTPAILETWGSSA